MAFCGRCGTEIEEGEQFCGNCGAKVEKMYSSPPLEQSAIEEYSEREIQGGKLMGILSYCSLFVLIPLFVEKNNRFVRFHVNQGLILFAGEVLWVLIEMVMPVFANISIVFVILLGFLQLNITLWTGICSLAGIVTVIQGKTMQLSIIGDIKILK